MGGGCGPGWCVLPCSLWGETQEYWSVSDLDVGLHHLVKDRRDGDRKWDLYQVGDWTAGALGR